MMAARDRVFAKPRNSGDLTDNLDLLVDAVCCSSDDADEFESTLQSFRFGLAQHWSSTIRERPAPALVAASTTAARVRRPESDKKKDKCEFLNFEKFLLCLNTVLFIHFIEKRRKRLEKRFGLHQFRISKCIYRANNKIN